MEVWLLIGFCDCVGAAVWLVFGFVCLRCTVLPKHSQPFVIIFAHAGDDISAASKAGPVC